MKLKSIQGKIAGVAGLCLLISAGILVGYSVYSAMSTQALVATRVSSLVEEKTLAGLKSTASTYAGAISRRLEPGLTTAQTLAKMIAADKLYDKKNNTVSNTRESFNNILRTVLLTLTLMGPTVHGNPTSLMVPMLRIVIKRWEIIPIPGALRRTGRATEVVILGSSIWLNTILMRNIRMVWGKALGTSALAKRISQR